MSDLNPAEIKTLVEKISFQKLTPEKRIVTDKVLDSIGLVDFVLALEKIYSISISDLEMTPENFDSVESIFELLKAKREIQFKK